MGWKPAWGGNVGQRRGAAEAAVAWIWQVWGIILPALTPGAATSEGGGGRSFSKGGSWISHPFWQLVNTYRCTAFGSARPVSSEAKQPLLVVSTCRRAEGNPGRSGRAGGLRCPPGWKQGRSRQQAEPRGLPTNGGGTTSVGPRDTELPPSPPFPLPGGPRTPSRRDGAGPTPRPSRSRPGPAYRTPPATARGPGERSERPLLTLATRRRQGRGFRRGGGTGGGKAARVEALEKTPSRYGFVKRQRPFVRHCNCKIVTRTGSTSSCGCCPLSDAGRGPVSIVQQQLPSAGAPSASETRHWMERTRRRQGGTLRRAGCSPWLTTRTSQWKGSRRRRSANEPSPPRLPALGGGENAGRARPVIC